MAMLVDGKVVVPAAIKMQLTDGRMVIAAKFRPEHAASLAAAPGA